MEDVRELEHVSKGSSSDIWIDLTEAMEKPVDLIYEFQSSQEVAITHSREEITKCCVDKEVLHPQLKEDIVEVAEGDVPRPVIIDLDSDEDEEEPTDNSMALVVVPDPPQDNSMALVVVPDAPQEALSNAELAILRVDNTETSETTSQSGMYQDQTTIGFNHRTVDVSAERESAGNGLTASRPGVWDGPPRWATSKVGILTVQCARCLKWRVVPSREVYEAIRECILETPWVCENAIQWRPDAHCDFPTDLNQDTQSLWAIDKPNLPSSPPGWSRRVVIRGDGSSKFADVYYNAPDGKNLRSMVEVAKYIEENPRSVPEGTQLNQFSYTTPQPLPGVWTPNRKRDTMRSVVNLSSSQGKGKKARAPQPLAKQLAQRLLHSNNPPSLPMPPSFPSHNTPLFSAPLFQPPGVATVPGPVLPQTIQQILTFPGPVVPQLLAPQAPNYPPVPTFRNPPNVPLFTSPLPPMRNPYPFVPSDVVRPSQGSTQDPPSSVQQRMSTSNAGRPDSSTAGASRSRKRQQKSRLGETTAANLPGVLPLREPNGV